LSFFFFSVRGNGPNALDVFLLVVFVVFGRSKQYEQNAIDVVDGRGKKGKKESRSRAMKNS
jgi:hypothetical protein